MAEVDDVAKVIELTDPAGRTFKVPRPNFGTEGEYTRQLKARALADLAAIRKEAGEQTYLDAVRAVTDSFASGRYDWNSAVWLASLDSRQNQIVLLWLCATQLDEQKALRKAELEPLVQHCREAVNAGITDLLFGRSPPTPPPPPAKETGAAP